MLILRQPWASQPTGAELDQGHWLWPLVRQGIIADPLRNATRSNAYTTAGSVAHGPSKGGLGLELSGAGVNIAAPSVASSSPWTSLSFGVARQLPFTCSVSTMAETPGNATYDRALYVNTTGTVSGYIFDGATKTATTTKALTVGVPALIAATSSGTALGAYVAGELATVAASNSGFTGYASPEFVIGYGGGGSNTQTSYWSTYYTLLLNRALTLRELIELDDNPWAIFEPRRIWIPLPAPAGGTTHSASVTESISAADAASNVLTATASLTESITSADVVAAILSAVATLTEAASASDSQAAIATFAAALTETPSLTDAALAIATAVAAVSEALSLTDSQSTSPVTTADLTESVSATDALTVAALLVSAVTELANVADVATATAQLVALVTETPALADGLATAATLNVSLEELASAVDVISAILAGGSGAAAADVWAYVLSNGKTAGENLAENNTMLAAMTALLADCPANLALVLQLLRNKQITNPSTGTLTVFADDGVTPLLQGNLFEDAAGTQPYRGQGAERRERLT